MSSCVLSKRFLYTVMAGLTTTTMLCAHARALCLQATGVPIADGDNALAVTTAYQ